MLAFIAVCLWAYRGRNKERFEEAALLPFADDMPGADSPLHGSGELGDRREVESGRGSQ